MDSRDIRRKTQQDLVADKKGEGRGKGQGLALPGYAADKVIWTE